MRALSVFISCSHLFSLQNKLRTNRSTACTSNTYCYRLVILTTSFMQFANNSLLLILIAIFLFPISFHFILSYRFSITSSDVFDGISYNILLHTNWLLWYTRDLSDWLRECKFLLLLFSFAWSHCGAEQMIMKSPLHGFWLLNMTTLV